MPRLPGKRYLDWQLEDPAGQGVEAVGPIRDGAGRGPDQGDRPGAAAISTTTDVNDVIGSGPADYAAALYTARGSLIPLVVGGAIIAGGSLTTTRDRER